MSRRLSAGILAIAVAGLLIAAPALAAALAPPVMHEVFTVQPCSGSPSHRTTLQELGCVEHQILRTDAQIDTLNRTIFDRLSNRARRLDFIAGHRAWLRYRATYCRSVSDVFRGGTEAGVLDAVCAAGVNVEHVSQLQDFARDLSPR